MTKPMIYLIGALGNSKVPHLANAIEHATGCEVFAVWFSPGPDADIKWQEYEKIRGRDYVTALNGYHANHVFHFDLTHLHRAAAVVMVLPAGKSAHLELGFALGLGKPGYILLDGEPTKYDVMYRFATNVFTNVEDLNRCLTNLQKT